MIYGWIEDIEEFRNIAHEWDEALIAYGKYNLFLLSDFIINWWKYFHNNLKLRIFVVYNNNKISGGIPLYIKRCGFIRILYYIGGSALGYTEPLYVTPKTEILPIIINALKGRTDWDALYLPDIRAQNMLVEEYAHLHQDEMFWLRLKQDHMNWAIDLSDGQEKYRAIISAKLRRDLRAKRRRLVKEYGEIRLKKIVGRTEIERYFDLYIQFSLRAFSARGRYSSLKDKKHAAFLKDFLVTLEQGNGLDAQLLLANDRILAISFGQMFGKEFNWLLTAFNYDYKYFRPGYLLIEELIQDVCNRGVTYYNWYGYERFYKTQWCNHQIPLYRFFLIRRTTKGICYKTAQVLKEVLRSNKAILRFIQRLKQS